MKDKNKKIKYLLAGALGGAVCGLFGAAGGMVNALLLIWWLKEEEKRAMATSVFCASVMSGASLAVYSFLTPIDFSQSISLTICAVAGGALGALFLKNVKSALLRRIFAIFIIYSAVRFIFS